MQILVFADYFLPGFKAGGPIRTIANMADRLGDEFSFKIITRDRDFGDESHYPGIMPDSWQAVGKAHVFYLSPGRLSFLSLRRLIRTTEHDVIYLNSFFSPYFTIRPLLLRRLGLISGKPLVIAPRGEFSSGALCLKSLKKRVYIFLSKVFGLYRGVIWQASSEYEKADILRKFGYDTNILTASDLLQIIEAPNLAPPVCEKSGPIDRHETTKGSLNLIFLSRISRKKNIDGALKLLNGLKGNVVLNIYGPLEDMNYWSECQKIIKQLPENIVVQYQGAVTHERVSAVMREHDLFFFPTLGENFGHVILEAFSAGCPVLISDQTPWRGLEEKGVGWDLPLDQPGRFQAVLQRCIEMENQEYAELSRRAWEYGRQQAQNDETVEQNRQLFYEAVNRKQNRMSSNKTEQHRGKH